MPARASTGAADCASKNFSLADSPKHGYALLKDI
jgi:hypothetical protein